MEIVDLIDITLHQSSVSEAAHSEWLVGTTYTADADVAGNTVYVTLSEDTLTEVTPHEIYLSTAAGNVGNYPPDNLDKWSLVSTSNRWQMFDDYVDSQTSDTSAVGVEIDSSDSDKVGLFNMQGTNVTLAQIPNTELVTDGDCTNDNFTKGTGWTHDAGNDEYDCSGAQAANSMLYQDVSTVEDDVYFVKFTVKNYAAGNIAGMAGGTAGTNVAADGTYMQIIIAGSDAYDGVIADSDFQGSVDDISIKRIVKTETENLNISYIDDYYEYFFGDFFYKEDILWSFPKYGDSRLYIEIATQGGYAKCGIVALGSSFELGDTRYDPQIGIADYSKKDTDSLGRTYLNQGTYAKTLEIDILLSNNLVDYVNRRLTSIRGEAAIFAANNTESSTTYESLIVYGFFEDFRIIIPGPNKSKCSIEIQGLI